MTSVKKLKLLYVKKQQTSIAQFRLKDFNKISIPTSYGMEIIAMNTIQYCKSSGNYCEIHLLDGKKILLCKTLKNIENKLNAQFLRVHNSFVVNLLYVTKIDTSKNQLTTINHCIIPISRSRKSTVLEALQ